MTQPDPHLPDDGRLRALVLRAGRELAGADPLGAVLLTGAPQALPDGGLETQKREARSLRALADELEALSGLAGADAVDQLALVHSIRRASPQDGPRRPAGSILVERHLLAALAGLSLEPQTRAEQLALMVEGGPAFLEAARAGCVGSRGAAGEVALAAAQRLPQLLDLSAAAARALPLPPQLRHRLEAGLGELLVAAAEDAGWLLKEYMPSADPKLAEGEQVPSGVDLGLDEIEAAAEAMLAEQAAAALEMGERPDGPIRPSPSAFPSDVSPREDGGLAIVAEACRRAQAACDPWCADPGGVDFAVEAQPSWLKPLLPPLSLSAAGPLSGQPIRLLVGDGVQALSVPELDRELALIHAAEYLPAAAHVVQPRLARLLLPAQESLEGWRALALADAPRVHAGSRRELGWRAMLALVAIGIMRGRLEIGEAAGLIAAETGMDPEIARMQSVHVAARPAAALTFVAGAVLVREAEARLSRTTPARDARASLLAAGPLPGVCLVRIGHSGDAELGYTP